MDIPEDVVEAARNALRDCPAFTYEIKNVAAAIMAERERCAQIARDFGESANDKFNGCVSDHAKGTRNLEYAAACAVGMCSAAEHIAALLEAHHA